MTRLTGSQEGLAAAVRETAEIYLSLGSGGHTTAGIYENIGNELLELLKSVPPTPMEDGLAILRKMIVSKINSLSEERNAAVAKLNYIAGGKLQQAIDTLNEVDADAREIAHDLLDLAANQSSPTPIEQGGAAGAFLHGEVEAAEVWDSVINSLKVGYKVELEPCDLDWMESFAANPNCREPEYEPELLVADSWDAQQARLLELLNDWHEEWPRWWRKNNAKTKNSEVAVWFEDRIQELATAIGMKK